MSISYINTILDNLKTEMETCITPGNFYNTSPMIERGAVAWQDTDGKRPFIWFVSTNIEYEETLSTTTIVIIDVELHGYADVDGYGGSDNMMKLLKDLEYFLLNDYSEPMNLVNCVISEGGVSEEVGQSGFMLSIKVRSEFNTETIN